MENFNNVPSSGTFGSVVSVVNQNFALAKEAIDKLAFSKSACMGFYETSSELNDAHPTPTDGDWALVGNSSPFNVYVANNGSWVDSGVDYNVSIDNSTEINGLGGYVVLDSVQELPASPSNPNLGYLIDDKLYVYVGTGGDTLDGKYKDCGDFKGPKGEQGVGFASASSPTIADGTWQITLTNGDTITINLNHTHENMAKLVVCEESDLPFTMDMDTIYAQVDDAETPTEIQSLWIAGLEFVGGGAIDNTPRLITPRDGLTLNFDGQSTIQLPVRGKNLLANLSLTITGDFTVTDGNNAVVSTITATAANDGVVLNLTKGSNYISGTLRISSSEVDVTVTLERDIQLPSGYSPLGSVSVNSMILSLAATNIPILSSWRLMLSSSSSTAQIAICQKATSAGRYFGITKDNKWGVSTAATIDGINTTDITEALVEFGNSLTRLTIGGNTVTVAPQLSAGNYLELFGCSTGQPYYFNGYVYEIECVSGGSFHAYPAKRLSDNAIGLYDIMNDVFYEVS